MIWHSLKRAEPTTTAVSYIALMIVCFRPGCMELNQEMAFRHWSHAPSCFDCLHPSLITIVHPPRRKSATSVAHYGTDESSGLCPLLTIEHHYSNHKHGVLNLYLGADNHCAESMSNLVDSVWHACCKSSPLYLHATLQKANILVVERGEGWHMFISLR